MTRHVRVVLEYLHPWTNSGGLFVAAAQGWFAEAGLDVELSSADPSRGDSLAYLARGEAAFAVFPVNRLFVRRAHGEPLTGLAAINHRAMETIRTYPGSGIERPRDLEGRSVAYNPTPRGTAMVRHLVAADGGDPDAVRVVDSGLRELSVADLAAGAADASFGNYWAWDVLFGDPGVYWPVDTIGGPSFHSYVLGAADATLDRDPELVRAFLAAAGRGYLAAVERPELALEAFERYIPFFPREILERSLTLISGTWTHDGVWGVQREELHAPYAAWLAANGVLPDAGVWRAATTNAYLEAA